MASVLLSASVERCFVSRMRDIFCDVLIPPELPAKFERLSMFFEVHVSVHIIVVVDFFDDLFIKWWVVNNDKDIGKLL